MLYANNKKTNKIYVRLLDGDGTEYYCKLKSNFVIACNWNQKTQLHRSWNRASFM